MNYSIVKNIDTLNKAYQTIQELYLNHNLIENLTGIEQFTNLRIFHIKFNFITNLTEFLKITNKTLIISLNFIGNPAESQMSGNPGFLNNFFNLRSLNTSKEASFLIESSVLKGNSNKFIKGKLNRKLQFCDENKENGDDGFLTGNFNNIRKNQRNFNEENSNENYEENSNENYEQNSNENYEQNFNENYEQNSNENYEQNSNENYEQNSNENNEEFNDEIIDKTEEISIITQRNLEKDPFDSHINSIDNDICRLSVIFYSKLLKEKTFIGLKRYFLHNYYRETRFCKEFYQKILINRGFFLWRKRFISKLLLQNFSKNMIEISKNIDKKSEVLCEELSNSALVLRGKKISKNYNLRKITETDQDFIDSNRVLMEKEQNNINVLRENNKISNEIVKKIGFSEYKEQSLKNGSNEVITEEHYKHDLPLSSTSFSSKCPYGSV